MMSKIFLERFVASAAGVWRDCADGRARFPVLLALWWAKAKRLRSASVRARECREGEISASAGLVGPIGELGGDIALCGWPGIDTESP